ncbi:hypothetical protein JVU11DRAFT_4940 [Chiua virens]|nr:hypothetical protein JVU11DRAFT_4940 [Chiua virens]
MAKPKHGRSNNFLPPPPSSPDSQHPARSHHPSRTFPRFPSPAVLSALAVIATSPPVVAGGPLPLPTPPPSFLCPFIDQDHIASSSSILAAPVPRANVPSTSNTTPAPTLSPPLTPTQLVADRYVQGSDDLWRKTDAWTLYGSTCCSSSTSSTSATASYPASPPTPTPSSSLTSMEFDTSVLPAGWDTQSSTSSNTGSTIILALAIVLAGSICIFMIGCVIWRKRKKKARDVERKSGSKLGVDDRPQDNDREKDARGRMRMWVKATARWKSSIRQSARRRRKRPTAPSIANRPLSPTFSDPTQMSLVALSLLSRRGSLVSEAPDPSRPDVDFHITDNDTEPPAILPDPPRPTSPPTYGASFPTFSHLPSSSTVSNPSLSLHSVRGNHPSLAEDEPLPYTPPCDGHVATDDKALLVRRLELASAPPIPVDVTSASAMQSVSAPEWHEVEDNMEDLGIDLSEAPVSCRSFGLPPSFPPPPSKVDMPFGYLDNQYHHYGGRDSLLVSDLVPGPARPPLPSTPALDDPSLEPSAPSLEAEDDIFQDWDGTSSHVPEALTSVDLDSSLSCAIGSSISTSAASYHSRQGILPRYQP